MHIGRSEDGDKTWNFQQIDQGPKVYGDCEDGSRINELAEAPFS